MVINIFNISTGNTNIILKKLVAEICEWDEMTKKKSDG